MSDLPTTREDYELTQEDAVYVAERNSGLHSVEAMLKAYPNNELYQQYAAFANSADGREREYGKLMLRKAAAKLNQQRKIVLLVEKYKERMTRLGDTALDVLEELMVEGRSEKVRADVAIEVTRHNLGSPDKDKGSGDQNVVIMIGSDPSQQIQTKIIDGEVVDG